MGNQLGKLCFYRKHWNEEGYRRLWPLLDSKKDGVLQNMEAPEDISLENFESSACCLTYDLRESYHLSIIHKLTCTNDLNLYHGRIPINVVFGDKGTYVYHISVHNGFRKKIMDLTIIRATHANDDMKYFLYHRGPDEDRWRLTTTYPYENAYQNVLFRRPRVWATASYFYDNIEQKKRVNLSKGPGRLIRIPQAIYDSLKIVLHVTCYDIQLVKTLDFLMFEGIELESGTIGYAMRRLSGSFTPNFFTVDDAQASGE